MSNCGRYWVTIGHAILDAESRPFRADKSLTHMPTPEMNALSYAQLGKLTELIDRYWRCFSSYFPPKELWDAKLKEVSQIPSPRCPFSRRQRRRSRPAQAIPSRHRQRILAVLHQLQRY